MPIIEILQRQATRKKHLNNFCQTHSYKIPVADDLKFILVDDKNKFMYCTIPKVGTTTWKNVFGNLRRLKENSFENIHQWDLWHRLSAYSEKGRRKRINTYFKFVFVREPFIRLISAFKDKFLGLDKWYTSREAREGITKAYRPQDLTQMETTTSPLQNSFNIFPIMFRAMHTGENTKNCAIRVLSTTTSLVI